MNELEKVYALRFELFDTKRRRLSLQMNRLGNLRVLLFVLMIVFLLQFFSSNFQMFTWWWLFLATVPVFAYFVKVHQKIFEQKELLDQLCFINEKEKLVQRNHKAQFEGGVAFSDGGHAYASDVDLFGDNSLFAHLNRCVTANGKAQLASLLKHQLPSIAAIKQQQQTVETLSNYLDFRQDFMAKGMLIDDAVEDTVFIQSWSMADNKLVDQLVWKLLRIVMPLLGITALGYFLWTFKYQPLLLVAFVNFILLGLQSKYLNQQHLNISKRQKVLKMYTSLLDLVCKQSFADDQQLNDIRHTAVAAQQSFQQLSSIIKYFDQRLNIFVGLGLNLIILYDIQCIFALEKWKQRYAIDLPDWIKAVAKIDVLISLSTYRYNHPAFTFPQVTNSDKVYVRAEALGHPLIDKQTRIASDTFLDQHQIYIVTGSNMAGKSTFLRTVALNVLLAQCGAPVCAQGFDCSFMQILTSMRVQDSINQQTSYFQAELLRLQFITEQLEKQQPTFVILDEILKGTNSEDKLLGSQLLVQRFMQYNCLVLIATHDLELGIMQQKYPESIQNLRFESNIQKGLLSFDYQLQKGIAKNKNATFLMRKMGIIPQQNVQE